ncbi:MAG: DUF6873 family GME fold protein [Oscillospiraceae bacterium]|jgi:hypothetical protein
MLKFIETPHLPEQKVKLLIAGERYRKELARPLEKLGISALWMPDNAAVGPRVSGHVDLSLVHLGGNKLLVSKEIIGDKQFVNILTNRGAELIVSREEQGRRYPADARLNVCILGNYLIENAKHADGLVSSLRPDLKIINVRQGYTKCSICVVDSKSIITSDKDIARKAGAAGINVLLIKAGQIRLPGFDAGFIGGAAFKTAADSLAFTGRIDEHPDEEKILNFLGCRNIKPVFLTDEPIFDIGSAIPLCEG